MVRKVPLLILGKCRGRGGRLGEERDGVAPSQGCRQRFA